MRVLLNHCSSHRPAASGYLAPLLVAAGAQQLCVELGEVLRLGRRHPVVAPEVAGLAFNSTLFVGFVGRAKLAGELPVRAEGNKALGFFPAEPPQDLLDRQFEVVVAHHSETPPKKWNA